MKLRALLALSVAALGSLVALVAPVSASAAPIAYPASVCSTLSVSTSTPVLGEVISVSGAHFVPGATVRLVLEPVSGNGASHQVGSVRVGSSGSFSAEITMPTATTSKGNYRLVAQSGYETGGSCPADPSTNLSLGAAGDNNHQPDAGGNGGTAFTGLDIGLLIAIAVVLVVAGSVLVARNRRRTPTG